MSFFVLLFSEVKQLWLVVQLRQLIVCMVLVTTNIILHYLSKSELLYNIVISLTFMKLYNLNRKVSVNNSFEARINEGYHFLNIWHYHSELELVAILKSKGTYFIGDAINDFKCGDVFLVGKNLPHMWLNSKEYFLKNKSHKAKAVAIHFDEYFLGSKFFKSPDMIHLSKLIEKSKYGIRFYNISKKLIEEMSSIDKHKGFERTMLFLNVLDKLSKHKDYDQLASLGYVQGFSSSKNDVIDRVTSYLFENFKRKISLKEISEIAKMHPSAFSRFFKKIQKKTYTQFVSEIRIGYACKLLLERNATILSICYEVGFNNLLNFNRQFKAQKNCSPRAFIEKYN